MATGRPKKVTDPLNDMGRRLVCADWEPSANTNYGDPKSAGLAHLVYAFLEDECQEKDTQVGNRSNGTLHPFPRYILNQASDYTVAEDESNGAFSISELKHVLQGLVSSIFTDSLEALLHKEVVTAVDTFKAKQNQAQDCKGCRNGNGISEKVKEKRVLKEWVMDHLRGEGFNAGICKSRWEHSNGFTAGDYEYVDVIIDGKERIFVGIDFRVEFVIARPTRQYNILLQILPELFVGKAERLKQIIKIMCVSVKKSLKTKGMHLPPWRKYESMEAKWLGSYKRTMKAISRSSRCGSHEVLGKEIDQNAGNGWDGGFWRDGRERGDGECWGEGEWMPPAVMVCAERGMKVSALTSALSEAG